MVLGGTTAEYDRKFGKQAITHINQPAPAAQHVDTDEAYMASVKRSALIDAYQTMQTELCKYIGHSSDEKIKHNYYMKLDRTNQRLEQLRTEK
ncbi:hypothetical protein AZI11_08355 [Levilactobacillus brevis]|uniref:hypothetical protein n=1 Tax=Levilactobacillus brevis TaxID=1580 RepID=UPI000A206666|nr:hypothetical protein [Levilactobacillus brevis]ARN92912.1 hypothetical protein AZI11_08355 [Levilactobacillus brevis]ARN95556.1 hypothetical protein AZI12_08405 [Levilactobacillus brevis]